jgi:hypothetical protein
MTNNAVFRSKHIEAEEFEPAYEVLEGQLFGLFQDKPLLHEALNDAALQRFQMNHEAVHNLYMKRKRIIDKKMVKYNINRLTDYNKYKKQ